MTLLQGKAGWGLLIALALVFPYVVPNNYFLSVMTLSYIFAIAALGLNLITGYTGQFNLAHGGFMAIGAYAVIGFWQFNQSCGQVVENIASCYNVRDPLDLAVVASAIVGRTAGLAVVRTNLPLEHCRHPLQILASHFYA